MTTVGQSATWASEREPLVVRSAGHAAEWLKEEIGSGQLSGMFRRGLELVHCPRIGHDGYIPSADGADDGPAQVRPMNYSTLASRIQYSYWVVKNTEDGPVAALFPKDAARPACDAVDLLPNVRPLRGVVHSPIVRTDGSILGAAGYDSATQLLYLPDRGLALPAVPERPTPEQVEAAVDLLDRMVAGFDFLTKSDKANYFGLLITPLLRELAPPPWKLAAIGAPQPGSGKTLLASVARIIHGGVFRSEMPEDDAEMRKAISTILDVTTGPVVHFDNCTGVLRSSTLAGLLTSPVWEDRRLGGNTMMSAANDRLWTITGNNLSLGGDLVRRAFWVTIDPAVPDPHLREDFAIPDLERWARDHRGELLAALLTLVRAWVSAGRPITRKGSDSYAGWIAAVDGILTIAAVPGVFDARESARQTVGSDDDEWREFLEAVEQEFGATEWTVKALLARVHDGQDGSGDYGNAYAASHPIPLDALPAELAERAARSRTGLGTLSKSLGRWLMNRDGRWAGRLTVRRVGRDRNKVALWRIQSLPDASGRPSTSGGDGDE